MPQYIVFEKRRVIVLPEGVTMDELQRDPRQLTSTGITAFVPVLNRTAEEGPDMEPRIFDAPDKDDAIDQHAGTGADLREGTYNAVSLANWGEPQTLEKEVVSIRRRG